MILECLMCLSLESDIPYIPKETKTQRIVRELFEDSYQKKKSFLNVRKVIVPIDQRTDFVVRIKKKKFLTVVYYFDI
jgi:hypothetical protein